MPVALTDEDQFAEYQRLRNDPLFQVLLEVLAECEEQNRNYGEGNLTALSGTGPDVCWTLPLSPATAAEVEKAFRTDYEAVHGHVSWAYLVREEIAEAFQEEEVGPLTSELTQAAALIVNWIRVVRLRGW